QGVLITALSWFGCALCGMLDVTLLYLGIGLILLALYLQSRIKKEDVWVGNESAWKRLIGSAPRRK
ncbi:MAG TPA: ABC transporter permease, partial [Methanocorpusculum sp.]|nr:ABC transporter permease [Methanocorpusculum sp.]